MREYNFDGLVGPTHNYGGLAPGNVASISHEGQISNPRAAALQGLEKMRFVASLGVGQGILPPHPRPALAVLRSLGFSGSDEEVLATASATDDLILRQCSSASAMWTANAATIAPSSDTGDGRVHFTPANLRSMFHRSIEADTTSRVLRAIFAAPERFVVHDPLPGGLHFADEGAANHTRLQTEGCEAVHLFAWGRRAWGDTNGPKRYPARQTLEASQALARLHGIAPSRCVFPRQHPEGIDRGAFHTDVLAVGSGSFLMAHELAFADWPSVEGQLRNLLGEKLSIELASERELPADDAVRAYPFNSQVLALPDGSMVIVAPSDSEANENTRRFLDRVLAGDNPVRAVHFLDVRQSMDNGGGPACLRLRVPLTDDEAGALGARVLADEPLFGELEAWIQRHYRDRLSAQDLADRLLWRESMSALDALTGVLGLGSVFDFQR